MIFVQKSCIQILALGYHNRHIYIWFFTFVNVASRKEITQKHKLGARLAQVFPWHVWTIIIIHYIFTIYFIYCIYIYRLYHQSFSLNMLFVFLSAAVDTADAMHWHDYTFLGYMIWLLQRWQNMSGPKHFSRKLRVRKKMHPVGSGDWVIPTTF